MVNNSFISNFKKWPWAAILTLCLLLITEGFARRYADAIRSFSDRLILYKKDLIESKDFPWYRGLIFGDSLLEGVNATILSRTLERHLNQDFPVYNLSLPEHGVQGYYLLLKKYLRHHPPPEVIFFSVRPLSWGTENIFVRENEMMSTGLHRFCLLFSMADCAEVFPAYFFPKAVIGKIERLSFLVTYRRMIRDFLEGKPLSRDTGPSPRATTSGRNGGVNFGVGRPPADQTIESSPGYNAVFTPDAEARFWYEKFFRLTQENNIRVIVFTAPLIEKISTRWEENGNAERYRSLMTDLTKEFPSISIVEPWSRPYSRTLFRDTHHLNGPGYERFSRELADDLIPMMTKLVGEINKE